MIAAMADADAKPGDVDELAELHGRVIMLETLLMCAMTHLAASTPDPAGTIGAIMSNAEDMLNRLADQAEPGDQLAAGYALGAFDNVGDAVERHLAALPGRKPQA